MSFPPLPQGAADLVAALKAPVGNTTAAAAAALLGGLITALWDIQERALAELGLPPEGCASIVARRIALLLGQTCQSYAAPAGAAFSMKYTGDGANDAVTKWCRGAVAFRPAGGEQFRVLCANARAFDHDHLPRRRAAYLKSLCRGGDRVVLRHKADGSLLKAAVFRAPAGGYYAVFASMTVPYAIHFVGGAEDLHARYTPFGLQGAPEGDYTLLFEVCDGSHPSGERARAWYIGLHVDALRLPGAPCPRGEVLAWDHVSYPIAPLGSVELTVGEYLAAVGGSPAAREEFIAAVSRETAPNDPSCAVPEGCTVELVGPDGTCHFAIKEKLSPWLAGFEDIKRGYSTVGVPGALPPALVGIYATLSRSLQAQLLAMPRADEYDARTFAALAEVLAAVAAMPSASLLALFDYDGTQWPADPCAYQRAVEAAAAYVATVTSRLQADAPPDAAGAVTVCRPAESIDPGHWKVWIMTFLAQAARAHGHRAILAEDTITATRGLYSNFGSSPDVQILHARPRAAGGVTWSPYIPRAGYALQHRTSATAAHAAAPLDAAHAPLLEAIAALPAGERLVVNLLGPPGVGKTTACRALISAIRELGRTAGVHSHDYCAEATTAAGVCIRRPGLRFARHQTVVDGTVYTNQWAPLERCDVALVDTTTSTGVSAHAKKVRAKLWVVDYNPTTFNDVVQVALRRLGDMPMCHFMRMAAEGRAAAAQARQGVPPECLIEVAPHVPRDQRFVCGGWHEAIFMGAFSLGPGPAGRARDERCTPESAPLSNPTITADTLAYCQADEGPAGAHITCAGFFRPSPSNEARALALVQAMAACPLATFVLCDGMETHKLPGGPVIIRRARLVDPSSPIGRVLAGAGVLDSLHVTLSGSGSAVWRDIFPPGGTPRRPDAVGRIPGGPETLTLCAAAHDRCRRTYIPFAVLADTAPILTIHNTPLVLDTTTFAECARA